MHNAWNARPNSDQHNIAFKHHCKCTRIESAHTFGLRERQVSKARLASLHVFNLDLIYPAFWRFTIAIFMILCLGPAHSAANLGSVFLPTLATPEVQESRQCSNFRARWAMGGGASQDWTGHWAWSRSCFSICWWLQRGGPAALLSFIHHRAVLVFFGFGAMGRAFANHLGRSCRTFQAFLGLGHCHCSGWGWRLNT